MQGLIVEGGSLRPIFSAGAMDALLKNNIMFPYCIGVSAGISNAVSYISRQSGRNLKILKKYRNDKRYISRRNFLKCKSLFGLDFVYDEIPNRLIPFDREAFLSYDGQCLVGITNAQSGKIEWKDGKQMDEKCTMLRATCAMPLFFPPIIYEGKEYYDGGLCAPIPIEKAEEDGCETFLIILSQPKGYVKQVKKSDKWAARIMARKYPMIAERILKRYIDYNKELERCEQLEKEGRAIIIRPEYSLNSFEQDVAQLEKNYYHGYEMVMSKMEQIHEIVGV